MESGLNNFSAELQRPFSSVCNPLCPNSHFCPGSTSILLVENLIFNFLVGTIVSVAVMVTI
uniref:Uncharacterized protein n=1 Tax=Lotus japonicus TaxID=34305 RepID=I3SJ11_LOTJA|nr:unknown [Lotus japonicus]